MAKKRRNKKPKAEKRDTAGSSAKNKEEKPKESTRNVSKVSNVKSASDKARSFVVDRVEKEVEEHTESTASNVRATDDADFHQKGKKTPQKDSTREKIDRDRDEDAEDQADISESYFAAEGDYADDGFGDDNDDDDDDEEDDDDGEEESDYDDEEDEVILEGVLERIPSDEDGEDADESDDEDDCADDESAPTKKKARKESVSSQKKEASSIGKRKSEKKSKKGKGKRKKGDDDDDDEDTPAVVQVDFIFCDMREGFFHGLKSLVQGVPVFAAHSSGLCNLMIENVSVGTVVSADNTGGDPDYDDMVYGFASVLNVTTYASNPAIQHLSQVCLQHCPADRRPELEVVLSGKTKRPAGFFLHGRVINLPMEIAQVLHHQLLLDMDWAVDNAEGGAEERKSLNFGALVLLAPCTSDNGGGDDHKSALWYKYFDDEIFASHAEFTFSFDTPRVLGGEVGRERHLCNVIVMTKTGHLAAMKDLKQMIHGKVHDDDDDDDGDDALRSKKKIRPLGKNFPDKEQENENDDDEKAQEKVKKEVGNPKESSSSFASAESKKKLKKRKKRKKK